MLYFLNGMGNSHNSGTAYFEWMPATVTDIQLHDEWIVRPVRVTDNIIKNKIFVTTEVHMYPTNEDTLFSHDYTETR